MASATFVGVRPPARMNRRLERRRPRRATSRRPRRRRGRRVDEHGVGAVSSTRSRSGLAGRERLDHEADPLADAPAVVRRLVAVELRGPQPGPVADLDDPLRASRRGTRRRSGPRAAGGGRCRGRGRRRPAAATGAKTKPTASAPMATARRASSSVVMPQIFTNIGGEGYGAAVPLRVDVPQRPVPPRRGRPSARGARRRARRGSRRRRSDGGVLGRR